MTTVRENLLKTVYLHGDEDYGKMIHRVVNHVMRGEDRDVRDEVLRLMLEGRFLPNTPTLMNAGVNDKCLSACFVLSIEDSLPSILETQRQMATIHSMGGGTGFSFSDIRSVGSPISSGGTAFGPLGVLEMYSATTQVIKQGGRRRGANMGVMSSTHPDVLEFVRVKRDLSRLQNFNLSVMWKDEQLEGDLFDEIVKSAWMTGDPGLLFYDRINKDNPASEFGSVEATNPCGEVPGPAPWACNLGSINVSKFVVGMGNVTFEWIQLKKAIELAVRFLDDVIDVGSFPCPGIEESAIQSRAIGLGIMGWADALLKLKVRYGSDESLELADTFIRFFWKATYSSSIELAKEKGPCPLDCQLSPDEQGNPLRTLYRNRNLLSIAPTGSLSILAGCSSGIEPVFAWNIKRRSLGKEFVEVHPFCESGKWLEEGRDPSDPEFPDYAVTFDQVTPEEHVKMQATFQECVDGGVSKTVNLPEEATENDVREVFLLAKEVGCKGITVYRHNCRPGQVLSTQQSKRKRPRKRSGETEEWKIGCGTLFVTPNCWDDQFKEVFAHVGKEGGCPAQTAALGILISMIAQGHTLKRAVGEIRSIKCAACIKSGSEVLSCPDAVARTLLPLFGEEPKTLSDTMLDVQEGYVCPDCGAQLVRAGGCRQCVECGWSHCG